MMRSEILLACVLLSLSVTEKMDREGAQNPTQRVLGHRSMPVLNVDGLQFKDSNRNGVLDPYEDWRLSPEARATDLAQRLSLEEAAGLMVHGTLPTLGPLGMLGVGERYDTAKIHKIIQEKHATTFITRLATNAQAFAEQDNAIQELAEDSRWGIPVTISSDPRHGFQKVLGANTLDTNFSHWPEAAGLGAANDPDLTRRFGNAVRQEFAALGIRESLAPQADLATEPRWARANGTFGEDAEIAKRMVYAYVSGVQNGSQGLNPGSVVSVVKHWVGYGAAKDGWDSHNFYGRYASFTDSSFPYHLVPFTGAFDAHVGSVMPTYSILQNLALDGKPVEPVGAGFNQQILSGLLRGKFGFKGVVLSDFAITNDCSGPCRNGAPAGARPDPGAIGMPWGVEDLAVVQRFAKAINAGVDQIGGTERSDIIVQAVREGLVPEARVRDAAKRILLQKFETGLFENPYVDPQAAAQIAGSADFVRQGIEAQQRAVVLLQNGHPKGRPDALLPVRAPGRTVYLYNIAASAAEKEGFKVTTDPSKADFAIVRAAAPYQTEHTGYFFGAMQHEGRLFFTPSDAGYAELLRVSALVPTVFVTTLERPLILTNVLPHSTALLADFGIMDEPLMDLIVGESSPSAHLPFELPSSQEAVAAQRSDLPHDSKNPLFPLGFGLRYAQPGR